MTTITEHGVTLSRRTYEQLESAFQRYCKHDGGRAFIPGLGGNLCSICHWDMSKCQHRNENGKFCSQCGEKLNKDLQP